MINRSIISPDSGEDYCFVNTSYNLATSIKNLGEENSLKSIKNITFVPRGGTHNNFKVKEEIFIYVINGDMDYFDSIGNHYVMKKGTMMYINAGTGMSYDIFNNGLDCLDIIEIETTLKSDEESSKVLVQPYNENTIKYNIWNYRVSSKNGLAPIKSYCDLNVYTLDLDENEYTDFQIRKNRTAYLLQCYGSSRFKSETTHTDLVLEGSDGLKITCENFEITAETPSNFILVESNC